jgi:hypothetical protein
MLNKLLSKVLIILPLNLICQIDTNSIFTKYDENQFKLVFTRLSNVFYSKTDTINGFELEYYYFMGGDPDRCISQVFFIADDISKFKSIMDLFQNLIASYQQINSRDAPVDHIAFGDTFFYRRDRRQYELSVFKYVKNNSLYKISNNEYLKLYKVKVIADVYEGDTLSLKMFNPLLDINNKSYRTRNVIFYQYRRVLKRKAYKPREILGMRRIKNKLYNQCIFSTW